MAEIRKIPRLACLTPAHTRPAPTQKCLAPKHEYKKKSSLNRSISDSDRSALKRCEPSLNNVLYLFHW